LQKSTIGSVAAPLRKDIYEME